MAKGYWIVRADITDPDKYREYMALNEAPFREFGATFLVRGAPGEAVLGEPRQRYVVLEFPSYQAAVDCYNSPSYQAALKVRLENSETDQVIVEGYDGPQPNG